MNIRIPHHVLPLGASAMLVACSTGERFAQIDTDNDGRSSRDEFTAYMKKEVFTIADQNHDGMVTESEWKAFNPDDERAEFVRADSDRSGGISRSEADAAFDREGTLGRLFDHIDTDGNQSLSRQELSAFEAKVKQQPGNAPGQRISNAAQS